jgi:nucleotidyltransferase substrate binding protein (TIGR01987 family)
MEVDPSLFRRAVDRLSESLARLREDPSDTMVRDAVIQRFEFTFDLATKVLRRALTADEDIPGETDQLSFPDMIRTAGEKGFTKNSFKDWHGYRDTRNQTSHTCDEAKAIEAIDRIPKFLDEAQFVVARLEARNRDE